MLNYVKVAHRSSKLYRVKNWFKRMLSIKSPIPCDGVWSSQSQSSAGLRLWRELRQVVYAALNNLFQLAQNWYTTVSYRPVRDYLPLEVLPDYYLNCNSAKRLWQDWRVLKRLFIRHDHSRDLLVQGQSGWLPINGITVNRPVLTITTDEGETVLNLDESIVWLSRANPANTQTQESTGADALQKTIVWRPV